MKVLATLATLIFSFNLQAAEEFLPQSPTAEVLQQMSISNQEQAAIDSFSEPIDISRAAQVLPFAEYQKTGYVFFNDDNYRGYATEIKRTIAKNLPQGVTLVVYSTSTNDNYLKNLKTEYLEYTSADQLIVLQIPRSGSNSFWTRDNLPLPVWTDEQFTLVDARYYYNFEPDAFLAELFSSIYSKHKYFFEGGNFVANSRGECIVVNRKKSYPGGVSDTGAIPDAIFKNHYGCKKLIRLSLIHI